VFNSDPPKVSVPNVVGQQVVQAENSLAEQGLKTARNLVAASEEDTGKVIQTNPPPDSEVEKGSLVTLDVGNGPETVKVPSLIDLTPEQAEGQLREAGLALAASQQQQVVEDEAKIGKIVAQNPPALADVPSGTQVQITIGVAPEKIRIISVVGDSFDEAKSNLESQGLVVQRQDVDGTAAQNEVVGQDPKAGTEVNKGATVTLQVSKGNQIKMIDLVGDSVAEARAKLQALGWTGTIEETEVPPEDPSDLNKIVEQEVAVDQPIAKDQTIRVKVASLGASPPTTTRPTG
jgi:eukaryotic-like serine/threonine-protein kinase